MFNFTFEKIFLDNRVWNKNRNNINNNVSLSLLLKTNIYNTLTTDINTV